MVTPPQEVMDVTHPEGMLCRGHDGFAGRQNAGPTAFHALQSISYLSGQAAVRSARVPAAWLLTRCCTVPVKVLSTFNVYSLIDVVGVTRATVSIVLASKAA